jgi:hypothetical protein
MLAFEFGLCRWSAKSWRFLVVYYRIARIPRLNFPVPSKGMSGPRTHTHTRTYLERFICVLPRAQTQVLLGGHTL